MENFEQIKNKKHIFIFGVCGRCSSTALQRILNSSGEVCIWGEQHYLIDELIELLNRVHYFENDRSVNIDNERFVLCFKKNMHFFPYMNAVGNLQEFKNSLINSIFFKLRPLNSIQRMGYKDIRLKSITTLVGLYNIFPQSEFIFLFRNPINQWPSIRSHKFWDYSSNLEDFLIEYNKISTIQIEFSKSNERCRFFENIDIDSPSKLKTLLRDLNVSNINPKVVKEKIGFQKVDRTISKKNIEKVISHPAYTNYLNMKEMGLRKISK